MLHRPAEIAINEQDALAGLRHRDGKIARKSALAVTRRWAGDENGAAFAVRRAKENRRADRTIGLSHIARWLKINLASLSERIGRPRHMRHRAKNGYAQCFCDIFATAQALISPIADQCAEAPKD